MGGTAEDYAKWIVDHADKMGSPEFETVSEAYKAARQEPIQALKETGSKSPQEKFIPSGEKTKGFLDTFASNPIARAAYGAASPVIGGVQHLMHLGPTGEGTESDAYDQIVNGILERQKGGEQNFGHLGTPAEVAGSMATGAKFLPASKGSTQVLAAGGTGAVAGALAPVEGYPKEYWTKVGEHAVTGAAVGGGLQAGAAITGKVARTLNEAKDVLPFIPGGPERIATRADRAQVPPESRAAVVDALDKAKPIVPNSMPTAAEAVAHIPEGTGIQASQKVIAGTPGGPNIQFNQRMADQERARGGVLHQIANTPRELEVAIEARRDQALINYKKAFEKPVKPDHVLDDLAGDPYFKNADKAIKDLAQSKGVERILSNPQYLHLIKLSLDKELGVVGPKALDKTEREQVLGVQMRLVDWMKSHNPAYEKASDSFERQSERINRMQLGQALEKRLVSPSTGKETPGSLLRALSDEEKLTKSATDFEGNAVKDILTQQEARQVKAVAADADRKVTSLNPRQPTNLRVEDPVAPRIPHTLSTPVIAANYIMKMFGKGVEPKVAAVRANRYLTPEKLARSLEDLPVTQRQQVIDSILAQTANPGIAHSVAKEQ